VDELSSNAMEVLVARTRRKIGSGFIETRRGFGYIVPEIVE
jgi:two-component system OmpR family response regulator